MSDVVGKEPSRIGHDGNTVGRNSGARAREHSPTGDRGHRHFCGRATGAASGDNTGGRHAGSGPGHPVTRVGLEPALS